MANQHILGRAGDQARRTVRGAQSWIEPLGRFGYAAKGIVYAIVGVLAALAAFGVGGALTGSEGALQWIIQLPFGQILLGVIAVGLIGYAIWRWVQALMDTERNGSDLKGLSKRAGYFISGLVYAALALTAARMALGTGDGGGNTRQDWTAWLLAQPFGPWLVGAVGLAIIGVGVFQFYKAYTAKFREKLKTGEMNRDEESWITWLGRFGFAARGVVFCIIGGFLIVAARQADPSETRGLSGALGALAAQPYGPWLLAIVALGLVAYGIFMVALARYRRMLIS
jgi:hypothetical protein